MSTLDRLSPVRRRCRELESRLRAGESARAEEYLAGPPALDGDDAIEVVYAEFVCREELGERPDPADYARRFPTLRDGLAEQFEVHAALREDAAPASGQCVGPYRLGREIGRGARGAVFRAEDTRTGREVALKLLLSGEYSTPGELALFGHEADVLARLDHPNLVRIVESGVADGRPYLALELVEGPTLAERAADFRAPRAAAAAVEALARALHHAHGQGVVHRDLKPGNVLVAGVALKLTDFGLARLLDAPPGRTRTGDLVGTVAYMAPEQAAGTAHRAGPPADLYALGAILYELLTGRPPFGPEPTAKTLYRVLTEPPEAPRRRAPAVPRDLETVCLQCLEKHPDRRYPSALALADDLRRFLDGKPVAARSASRAVRLARWVRRHPTAAAAVGLAALGAAGAVSGLGYHNARLSAALSDAETLRREAEGANRGLSDALAVSGGLRAEAERQLDDTRRAMFALRLSQLPALWLREPVRARGLLNDPAVCPPELRDFTWRLFRRLCMLDERVALNAHGGEVRCVAFLGEGVVVSGGADGKLRTWYPDRPGNRWAGANVAAHRGGVTGAAAFDGGRRVATSGRDSTVKLWDAGAAKPRATIWAGTPLNAVAADGKLVAAAGDDGRARVWDIDSGELLRLCGAGGEPLLAAALAPGGRLLALAGADRVVRLWDWRADRLEREWPGHDGPVLALAFAPDGRSLVSTGEAGDAKWWDVATGAARPLRGHLMAVRAAAFAPGGRFATGGGDTYLKLWDAETGAELSNLMNFDVGSAALSPGGSRVAVGGWKGRQVGVYRVPTFPPPAAHPHPANVAALAALPGGCATADESGEVRLWRRGRATPDDTFAVPTAAGPARPLAVLGPEAPPLAAAADGSLLAVGVGGDVVLRDPHCGAEAGRLGGHPARVTAVAFHPDGARLLSGAGDGSVRVWDLRERRLLRTIPAHGAPVLALAATADGRWLATGGEETFVRLWNLETGAPGPALAGGGQWALSLAFSPDGTRLACGDRNRTVRLWSLDQPGAGVKYLTGFTNWVYSVAFAPDGRTLAAASGHYGTSSPGELKLFDPRTGYVRAILGDFRAPAAFAPDGRSLLVGVRGGVAELEGE